MGEYSTRTRYTGAAFGRSGATQYGSALKAEYVYSWRDRRSDEDLSMSESQTPYKGVKMPSDEGNLWERIKDRKRFWNDINSALLDKSRGAPTTCFPLTDKGHRFTSISWTSVRQARYQTVNPQTGIMSIDTCVLGSRGASRPQELSSIAGYWTQPVSDLGTVLGTPNDAGRQAKINPAFYNMVPTSAIASISETVISLLRGEFPSVVRNLSKIYQNLGRDGKDIARYGGGEYLNSVFGWQPLIRDFENAIKVLFVVDSLIYGTAYRRSRIIRWDSQSLSEMTSTPLRALNGYYPGEGTANTGLSTSSLDVTFLTSRPYERRINRIYDLKISTRIVPIARPTRGANQFVDEVQDKLELLGIWKPSLGWDLLPYSWLIDWYVNLGASLNNAFTFGNEPGMARVDYAWGTSKMTVLEEYDLPQGWYNVSSTVRRGITGSASAITVVKNRIPISPFGFGMDLSGLNPSQVAILVALGLVKIP